MKVKELIEKLKSFDDNLDVFLWHIYSRKITKTSLLEFVNC